MARLFMATRLEERYWDFRTGPRSVGRPKGGHVPPFGVYVSLVTVDGMQYGGITDYREETDH